MQQQHELNGDIEHFLQSLQGEESAAYEADMPHEKPPQPSTEQEADEDIQETIHVYFVREQVTPQKEEQVIESTPPISPQSKSDLPAYTTILLFLFLPLSCLAFQLYLVFNPTIVTVTLVPRSQVVSLSGTLQLGRVVSPITLSQSQTIPTTGKGHQDPRAATGSITLFNGQLTSVTVPAGTAITSASGVAIVTDQDATIPPADSSANPPIFGQVTISAHATNNGKTGNIAAYDINQPCCSTSIIAKNMTPFTGGQDKRNFQMVSKADIGTIATALKTTLAESMQGALQGQLRQGEALQTLPCTPTVSTDHHIGQEAAIVNVKVSETCSAIAYNNDALVSKATELLSHLATHQLGTGYSLIGNVQVRITQATVTHSTATLLFSCQGTWLYALSQEAQQQMKHLIAGKTKPDALHILLSLPGIESESMSWDENTKLPKNIQNIHFQIIIQNRN